MGAKTWRCPLRSKQQGGVSCAEANTEADSWGRRCGAGRPLRANRCPRRHDKLRHHRPSGPLICCCLHLLTRTPLRFLAIFFFLFFARYLAPACGWRKLFAVAVHTVVFSWSAISIFLCLSCAAPGALLASVTVDFFAFPVALDVSMIRNML